jgi:hypothetical protein
MKTSMFHPAALPALSAVIVDGTGNPVAAPTLPPAFVVWPSATKPATLAAPAAPTAPPSKPAVQAARKPVPVPAPQPRPAPRPAALPAAAMSRKAQPRSAARPKPKPVPTRKPAPKPKFDLEIMERWIDLDPRGALGQFEGAAFGSLVGDLWRSDPAVRRTFGDRGRFAGHCRALAYRARRNRARRRSA